MERLEQLAARAHMTLARFARRADDGASLIEYAFLVALIAIVALLAVTYFGTQTSQKFSSVGSAVGSAG